MSKRHLLVPVYLIIVFLSLQFLILDCGKTDRLTLEQLQNISYQSDWAAGNIVKLVNGEYEEVIADDPAARLFICLDETCAFGDINLDAVEDAAVLLVTNAGGSGTFYDMAAVINTRRGPEHIASAFLGDRVKVKSISIDNGAVIVSMITHGPEDPFCCPTMEVTQVYVLEGERLIRFSDQ